MRRSVTDPPGLWRQDPSRWVLPVGQSQVHSLLNTRGLYVTVPRVEDFLPRGPYTEQRSST